ncbi:MAG TPA: helix-turn-helix transcriptional regulator [Jiangellaceae bacterium]|nr:helix-turn-helix transcriptional regulator [Jiangellaceae bacterium]
MSPRTQQRRDAEASSYGTLRRIGAAVASRRCELELGKSDLATRLGVPTGTLIAVEQGRYDPRLSLIPRLEHALATSPGTIGQSCIMLSELPASTGRGQG